MWVWNRTRVDGVNESGDALTTAPSGIWLLTVSDDAIAGVASRLAQTHPDLSEVTAFHCAGRYDVELLAPLASKGCKIGYFIRFKLSWASQRMFRMPGVWSPVHPMFIR